MPSNASQNFTENKKDIETLWHIHAEVAGSGRGRKHRVDILNRSAMIFASACWESYTEDVATEAFDFLPTNAGEAGVIPAKVRVQAAKELCESKDERRIWELAGLGWQKVMLDHRDKIIEAWLKSFNTPKSKQIDELFLGLLDLSNLTDNWSWQGMSAEQAREKLDKYITVRGNIAHRTKHDENVYKNWGKDF